jgi:hypothetical protein
MKEKKELLTNFNFFSIPTVEILQEEIQSLCNFSFSEIIKIEPTNKVQSFFQKEIPSVPVKHHFSYLSLHQSEWNEPKLSLYIWNSLPWHNFLLFFRKIFEEVFCVAHTALK